MHAMTTEKALPKIFDLPSELLQAILCHVDEQDLLTLRLATHDFDHVVCPIMFKELVLLGPDYTRPYPAEEAIGYLTSEAKPWLSIGHCVQSIRLETRSVTMAELHMAVRLCPNTTTLVIPYKTLRDLNRWMCAPSKKDKKNKSKQQVTAEPTDTAALHLFKKLFIETTIRELRVPGAFKDELFYGTLIYCLVGLRHLDLGQTSRPAFDLAFLKQLQHACPILESLSFTMTSDNLELDDILSARTKEPSERPFYLPSLRHLSMRVTSTMEPCFRKDPVDSTLFLAYLALVLPDLEELHYLWYGQENIWMGKRMQTLGSLLGDVCEWQKCFSKLIKINVVNVHRDIYVHNLLFKPSVTWMEWNDEEDMANFDELVQQMAVMSQVTHLSLGNCNPTWIQRPAQRLSIEQLLDTFPRLLFLNFLGELRLCFRFDTPGNVDTPLSPRAHPLQRLEMQTIEHTDAFEYISLRCPDLSVVRARSITISATDIPMGIRFLMTLDTSSNVDSLSSRLDMLKLSQNVLWMPLMHTSLSNLDLDQVVLRQFGLPCRYAALSQAPSYSNNDRDHSMACHSFEITDMFTEYMDQMPTDVFLSENSAPRIVILTRKIKTGGQCEYQKYTFLSKYNK